MELMVKATVMTYHLIYFLFIFLLFFSKNIEKDFSITFFTFWETETIKVWNPNQILDYIKRKFYQEHTHNENNSRLGNN